MKKLSQIIIMTLCLFMLGACAKKETVEEPTVEESVAAESDLAYIQEKGTLIVGITDFEPMDYRDDAGNWIGFDADVAKKVAEDLGVQIEFVEIDWDNKIFELENKTIDVVWNGMTLTNEVKNAMATTDPYCNNAQVVVLKADRVAEFNSVDDLQGLQFAVEAGSAGEAAAQDNGFNFVSVATQADTLLEVAAGTSDASIMAGAMIGEGTSYSDLTYKFELTSEEYGAGCRKGSDLAAYINEEFKKFAADGSLRSIAETYGVQESLIIK